jgi:hypothetical protein
MDTRFWGPSGWRLLHTITFAYVPRSDKAAVRDFFMMLPFVLPCKYCRTSLSEYMEKYNIDQALESRSKLCRWLWKIHNEVNSKLRNQKIPVNPDPSFEEVEQFYNDILSSGCSRTDFPGWDFLFSIADLHPFSKSARTSAPITKSGAPSCESLTSLEEKNKRNCLKPEERLPLYNTFWKTLGMVLPFKEWRESWAKHSDNSTLDTRSATMKWLWNIRCNMENDLELLNRCNYSSLCKTLNNHRSDCNKKVRGKTCRKRRSE